MRKKKKLEKKKTKPFAKKLSPLQKTCKENVQKEKQKINVLNETSHLQKNLLYCKKKTRTKETAISLKKIETKTIFQKNVKKHSKMLKLYPYFCYVVLFLLKKTQTFDKKDFEKNLKKKP